LELVFAEDDDSPRRLIRDFKRFLQAKTALAQLNSQPLAPQFPGKRECGWVQSLAQRRDVGVSQFQCCFVLGQQRQNKPVLAHGEADPRRLRSANSLAQPVVAPTAQQGVLCTQSAMRKFESGSRVIVESTHKAVIACVGYARCVERRCYCGKVCSRCVIQRICNHGKRIDDRLIGRDLAVQYAQWVGNRAPLAIHTHLADYRNQSCTQRFVIARPIRGGANRIQLESPAGNTQFVQQRRQHFKNFSVA
jgi:hypothetical protein